ncbi:MAG: hypothetical protein MJ191_02635 [Clostridium sp.]|nr:hypothetical protein [Clostridium sp.]
MLWGIALLILGIFFLAMPKMKFYKKFLKKHNTGKGDDFWGFLSIVTGGVCLVFAISAIVGNLIQ